MDRSEHMEWCKARAFEYIERGEPHVALTSMFSDLSKHPETAGHVGIQLGIMQMMIGQLSDVGAARRFIEGFN